MKTKFFITIVVAAFFFFNEIGVCASWNEFKSAKGAFSIMMPGNPIEQTQSANTAIGVIEAHLFTLKQEDAMRTIGYTDYPAAFIKDNSSKKLLDDSRDSAISNTGAKLIKETPISLGVYPGREMQAESPDGTIIVHARTFLVKNRVYTVQVVAYKQKFSPESNSRFFDSFKVTAQ
jgi:hypothetical protein